MMLGSLGIQCSEIIVTMLKGLGRRNSIKNMVPVTFVPDKHDGTNVHPKIIEEEGLGKNNYHESSIVKCEIYLMMLPSSCGFGSRNFYTLLILPLEPHPKTRRRWVF